MSKVAFRQCDVERSLRALQSTVDISNRAVKIMPDGSVVLLTPGEATAVASQHDEIESFWDRRADGQGRP